MKVVYAVFATTAEATTFLQDAHIKNNSKMPSLLTKQLQFNNV